MALAQVDVVLKPTRTLPPITMPAAAMSQALRPMPVTVQVEPEGICLTKVRWLLSKNDSAGFSRKSNG